MANCLFGFPVWNDPSILGTPTYFGGSWAAALPLTNLSDRRLAKVARSSSAAVADTVFQCGLFIGLSNRVIGVVAIPRHTISQVGTIRVRLNNGNVSATSFNSYLDFAAGWTSVGTPTRVAANFIGSDGVPLDLIGDDSGAALEGYTRVLPNLNATGQGKVVTLRVAAGGSSTSLVVRLRDTTAPADRLLAVINPNAVPPTPTMTTGTLLSVTLVGTEYRIVMLTTNLTTANTHQLEVYPASTAALAVANTGTANAGDVEVTDFNQDRLQYDSGYVTPWPAGLTVEDVVGLNVPFVAVMPTPVLATLCIVEIRDPTNPAGFIDLARLIVAGAYQPAVNMSWGSGLGLEDLSTRDDSDGAPTIFTTRAKRRVVSGVLEDIAEAEAFGSFWKMQQQLGTTGQLFFMWDSADTTYKHIRSFLAVFKTLSPLEAAYMARHRGAFALVEEL